MVKLRKVADYTAPEPVRRVLTETINGKSFEWHLRVGAHTGQYADGSWWVLGSNEVVKTTPQSKALAIEGGYRHVNGMMKNPSPWVCRPGSHFWGISSVHQGFDSGFWQSKNYQPRPVWYNPEANLGLQLPVKIDPGDSLVLAHTEDRPAGGRSNVSAFSVLTCVDTVPPTDAFRPGFGQTKGATYRYSDLNLSLLPSVSVAGTPPDDSTIESYWQGPRCNFFPLMLYREAMPSFATTNPPDPYSGYQNQATSVSLLHLCRDDRTDEAKAPVITGVVQYGLDLYHTLQDALTKPIQQTQWEGGLGGYAGQTNGLTTTILVAGHLLEDAALKSVYPSGSEVGQYFYVPASAVSEFGYFAAGTSPNNILFAEVGDPEWAGGWRQFERVGEAEIAQPSRSLRNQVSPCVSCTGPCPPGVPVPICQGTNGWANYRITHTATNQWGFALYALLSGLHADFAALAGGAVGNAYFQYLDRYRLMGQERENLYGNQPWQIQMWDAHRPSTSGAVPIWTP